jgi:hypothetical protein
MPLTSLPTIDTSEWKPRGALWLKSKTGSTGKFTRYKAMHEKRRPCKAAVFCQEAILEGDICGLFGIFPFCEIPIAPLCKLSIELFISREWLLS